MKIPAQAKGLKDEFCTLQFDEVDSEESGQIAWEGGTTHSCQILTKPGVPITLHSTINLGENVEEFIDYVFDGVLRTTSTVRKGLNKKYVYKIRTDKAVAYRFEGGKRKGLKVYSMEAKLRSAEDELEVESKAGAPETSVSTIDVQHWRKNPEGSESSNQHLQGAKRAPLYDKFPRWTDLEQSFPDDTPHEYAIDFTGDVKLSKTLKDRLAEEKPGFKLFRTFKFHLVSPEEFQKLGGAAPLASPQVVLPTKEHTKDKGKEKVGENDKKVKKSVKGKEKESDESCKAEKAKTPGPEKSSSDVAEHQETGEKSNIDESTTTKKKLGESAQPIEIDSQSTVRTHDNSEPITDGAEPVATVKSLAGEDDKPGHEDSPELEQDQNDEHTNDNSNNLSEKPSVIKEKSHDSLLDEYCKTVDEVIDESKVGSPSNGVLLRIPDVEMDFGSAIEENTEVLLEESDVDLDLPVPPPAFAEKKPSVLLGMKGGPADQAWREKDLTLEGEKIIASVEGVFRGRSSTPVQGEPAVGDGEVRKGMEISLMTPPPSTEKKSMGSFQIPGFPAPFNLQQNPSGRPLQNVDHVFDEGMVSYTALKTAPRRSSVTDVYTGTFESLFHGTAGVNPLDLSLPMESIESRIASSQKGNGLLRGCQAGRGRSASPAARSFSPNYRVREWHTKNGDAGEDISNHSLFADAVQPNEEVSRAQEVQPIETVEKSPQAEPEQEKNAQEVQGIYQDKIEEAQKVQDVVVEAQMEKELAPSRPRTPTQRAAAPPTPDTPNPQRASTPRAATPPTPTPQPRARPSASSKKPRQPTPAVESASSKKSQASAAVQTVTSTKPSSKKHQPPPVVQPTSSKKSQATQSSKKPSAAAPLEDSEPAPSKKSTFPSKKSEQASSKKSDVAASKKSEANSSKKTQPATPAVQQTTSKKRKADAASTKDIDDRPSKHASTPAPSQKTVLAQRLEEAKTRIEAATKVSEKLKEKEDMILEVQKLEQEARALEKDNALRKSNIERVGGSFK